MLVVEKLQAMVRIGHGHLQASTLLKQSRLPYWRYALHAQGAEDVRQHLLPTMSRVGRGTAGGERTGKDRQAVLQGHLITGSQRAPDPLADGEIHPSHGQRGDSQRDHWLQAEQENHGGIDQQYSQAAEEPEPGSEPP